MSLLIAGQGGNLESSNRNPFRQKAGQLLLLVAVCRRSFSLIVRIVLRHFTTSLLYSKNPAQGRVRKQCGHWQKPYLLLAFLALCILLCFGLVMAVELLCIVLFCVTVVDEGWVAVFDVED
jgi:hypothetical protein